MTENITFISRKRYHIIKLYVLQLKLRYNSDILQNSTEDKYFNICKDTLKYDRVFYRRTIFRKDFQSLFSQKIRQ